MAYKAPVDDIRFILRHILPFDQIAATDRFAEATDDMVDAILTEAGRLAEDAIEKAIQWALVAGLLLGGVLFIAENPSSTLHKVGVPCAAVKPESAQPPVNSAIVEMPKPFAVSR